MENTPLNPFDKLITFLKGNHTWTRIYKPNEITDPIAKAIKSSGDTTADAVKSIEKPLLEAVDSNKITAKINLGQGIELSLPITTELKGPKGDEGKPGKDVDEERVIREVLKKIVVPKPNDGKDADEERIIKNVLKQLSKPKNGKDAIIDYPRIVKETVSEIQREFPGWKPMTEFEIQELIREATKDVRGIRGFTKEDRKSIVNDLKKEISSVASKVIPGKQTAYSLFQRAIGVKNLDDVELSNPTNGQGLVYNATKHAWENGTVSGGGGGSVDSVVAGNNIDVDATDPANPIVSVETLTLADISDVTASATEVNYTDGVTSAIQTQLNAKAPSTAPTFATSITGSYLTASELLGTGASKEIVSLPVATYPSLTELTYVKGVTSAIQTQLNAKANSAGSLTQFVGNTAHRVFYADGSGDIQELALGADGTFLKSNGASVAPSFATPAGSGDVSKVGTPVNNQVGVWTGDGTLEGDAALTFDTATDTLTSGVLNATGLTASEIVLTDASKNLVSAAVATYPSLTELTYVKGVTSAIQTQLDAKLDDSQATAFGLSLLDDLDAAAGRTTLGLGTAAVVATDLADLNEATIEGAIDTLANLTSVQGRTVTLADAGADALLGWDDSASAYQNLSAADALVALGVTSSAAELNALDGITSTVTELNYTDGVTSAIQTQLNAKAPIASPTFTGTLTVPVGLTGVLRADTGVVSVDSDVTDIVAAASTTAAGKVELATDAEMTTGTDTARAITPANAKVELDKKLALAGGTMSGNITLGENTSIALDPAGSADGKYSGITVTGTAGYTQAFGDLVYLDPTDSRWEAVDANSAAGADGDARGLLAMVVSAGTDGNACTLLLSGIIRADAKFPTFTVNNPIYVSETAGAVTQTQPTTTDAVIRIVGAALTADEMFFRPDFTWVTPT